MFGLGLYIQQVLNNTTKSFSQTGDCGLLATPVIRISPKESKRGHGVIPDSEYVLVQRNFEYRYAVTERKKGKKGLE